MGALDEEVDRLLVGERLDVVALLAADPQQHTAGDQDRELGRLREQGGEDGSGLHHLLEVVEHEQETALAQRGRQVLGDGRVSGVADAQGLRDAAGHAFWVVDGGQIDEHGAVLEVRRRRAGCCDRQPALPDPARTDQRHEPGPGGEHPADGGDVALTPDQPRERDRQANGIRHGRIRPRPHDGRARRLLLVEGQGPALIEPLGEEDGEIRLDQPGQLLGGLEVLVGGPIVVADPVEQTAEPLIAVVGRLHVQQPRHVVGAEVVLVFEPRDLLVGRHPAVAFPVQPEEDVGLLEVRTIELPRRMRPRAELEHDGSEVQPLDGRPGGTALRRKLLQSGRDEDA